MNPPIPKHESTQAQVERLTGEAKKFSDAGKESEALEVYRTAASLMPGAPWLQQRTAELARKLKQTEIAVAHYRRAASAFIMAGFPKRGVGPLRTAWTSCLGALPEQAAAFVMVTTELCDLQRELGFGAESVHLLESSNDALRAKGCRELVPTAVSGESHLRPTIPVEPPREPVRPKAVPDSGITATAAAANTLLQRVHANMRY